MTATDELRLMLDERWIEYEVDDAKTVRVTRWRAYGDWVSFIEYDNGDTKFCIDARRLTPEQASHISVQDNLAETEGMGDVWLECDACNWQMPLEPSTPHFNFCPNCGKKVVDE